MITISEPIEDISGTAENRPIVFWTEEVREADDGSSTVTTRRHQFLPVNGVLTTGPLHSGPAKVRFSGQVYDIFIPEGDGVVRLWPLIEAGLPTPDDPDNRFVRNARNVRRIADVTLADYLALTPDPDTVYLVFEN